jgi:hypothetical protein
MSKQKKLNKSESHPMDGELSEEQRIQIEILKKIDKTAPTYAQPTKVITDMDVFPYNRFFRGNPSSTEPVVFEREAGWRVIYPSPPKIVEKGVYPRHCFEPACSTIYPCYSADYTGGMRNNCVNLPP